jgi:hypothetical protein
MEAMKMVTIISETEAVPSSYPAAPSGLSTAAAALPAAMVWNRIEQWVAHRWTSRTVIWVLEGNGDFFVPLTPATVTATERWTDGAWAAYTVPTGPLGYCFETDGTYRITATVGGGSPTVPDSVKQAYLRIAEYMAADPGMRGASSYSVDLGGISENIDRNPAWLAKAIHNSGAADLLRPYRRAVQC